MEICEFDSFTINNYENDDNVEIESDFTPSKRARVRTNSETDESDHSDRLYVENESNQKRILLEERFSWEKLQEITSKTSNQSESSAFIYFV